MATFNKVFSFLVLVLAAISLAFGWRLSQRRVELRDRGEKLADSVADVAKQLDTLSGTQYAKELNRGQVAAADGSMLSGGKLGWAYYHSIKDPATGSYTEFDNLLKSFRAQAQGIREQRDALAKALVDVGDIMEKQGLEATSFSAVADKAYETPIDELKKYLKNVHTRDQTIFSKVEESAMAIHHPMAENSLKDLENYEVPMQDFVSNIKKLYTRCGNYVDTLAQITNIIDEHEFEVDVDRMKNEDGYAPELETLLKDYARINESLKQYKQNKIELEEMKDRLGKNLTALEDANENIAKLEAKNANLEADLQVKEQEIARLQGGRGQKGSGVPDMVGKVIHVNYDWNYIIIDKGAADKVQTNINGTVARGQEFICKATVTQVLQKYSVLEILPDMRQGTVVEGDRVIF